MDIKTPFSKYILFFVFVTTTLFQYTAYAETEGRVIAFAGLSGSGKTATARELANLLSAKCVLEPEEEEWPEVIGKREEYGTFTMWMGFREMWVPLQYQAQAIKNEGNTVFLDAYFVKIIKYELDLPGMEWLFDRNDPYYNVYRTICDLDVEHLPDPDCLVLFDVTFDTWLNLLATRDREWDRTPDFIESFQQTKDAIETAVVKLCQERNITLIRFQQEFGDVAEQTNRLKNLLINEGIISE